MKLSEIMSHAGLAGYAVAALVLFLAVFAAQAVRVWRRPWRTEGLLPFDDEATTTGAPGDPRPSGDQR